MSGSTFTIPRAFIFRRLHSLLGLWLVLFLIEHLLTNSQAALLLGENGKGFIHAVNFLKNLPYLPVVEIVLLGVPILFHGVWGIKYLMSGKMNSFGKDGKNPSLPEYKRNQAYSLQRITSWVLLVGLIGHIGYMRFYKYPAEVNTGEHSYYFVRLRVDPGLYTVADRLGVKIYDQREIRNERIKIENQDSIYKEFKREVEILKKRDSTQYKYSTDEIMRRYQHLKNEKAWLKGLETKPLGVGQVIAESSNFGTATLFIVRDSFKNIFIAILYTLFVLSAVFHAFNGLWTFIITWGIVLKMRSQLKAVSMCTGIMLIIGILGLASIWGTYWINLRY